MWTAVYSFVFYMLLFFSMLCVLAFGLLLLWRSWTLQLEEKITNK